MNKPMIRILISIVIVSSIAVSSCKKGPGEGGKSKITGKVWIEDYNTLNNMYDTYKLKDEYPGVERDVYLVFGSDISYGLRTKTGYDGVFEFDYLREGGYTVYVESKDTSRTSVSGITSMLVPVSLGKKETGDAGTIVIYK
jgi:hypothetical protein